MPRYEIHSEETVRQLRGRVHGAAARASAVIVESVGGKRPLEALAALKFDEVGFHPTEERRLNLIEQVNQTFTYLASLAAAERVLHLHPGAAPIRLNLGTSAGYDVESPSQGVVAEVFAAVRRTNNRKLVKDVAKVSEAEERNKYVFFFCPGHEKRAFHLELFPDVQIVPLTQEELWGDLGDGV